jgi:hypothetical protein
MAKRDAKRAVVRSISGSVPQETQSSWIKESLALVAASRPLRPAKVNAAVFDSGRDAGEALSATLGWLSTFAPHFCIE